MSARSIFYTLAILASLGTVGAVISNPQIVQQGAALLGFNNNQTEEANATGNDAIDQFLQQHQTPHHKEPNRAADHSHHAESQASTPSLSLPTTPFPTFPSTSSPTPTPTQTPTPPSITSPPPATFNPPTHTDFANQNIASDPFENNPYTIRATNNHIAPEPTPHEHHNKTASFAHAPNEQPPFEQWSDPPAIATTASYSHVTPSASAAPAEAARITHVHTLATHHEQPVTTSFPANFETNNPISHDAFSSPNVTAFDRHNTNLPNLPVNTAPENIASNASPFNTATINAQKIPTNEPNPIVAFADSGNNQNSGLPNFQNELPPSSPPSNSFPSSPFPSTTPETAINPTPTPTPTPLITSTPLPSPTPSPVQPSAIPRVVPSDLQSSDRELVSPRASDLAISPSVMAENVPCIGTETVARVGSEVILMCDILPQLRRFGYRVLRENLKTLPPERRDAVTEEEKEEILAKCVEMNFPDFLKIQIENSLVHNDFLMSFPREQAMAYEKRLGEEFDRKDIPAMMKEFGVSNTVELKKFLKENLGSSLERERMLSIRNKLIQMWVSKTIQESNIESTYDELKEYYVQHKEEFTKKEQVKWKEIVVLNSKFASKQEALHKMNWLINEVKRGVSFEELAKLHSDGLTAPKGGIRDWTKRGDISSKEVENVIFSIPVGQISNIIETDIGMYAVLVTEHNPETVATFIDAQAAIRTKIRNERLQQKQTEYYDNLKQKYRVIVMKKNFNLNVAKPISRNLN